MPKQTVTAPDAVPPLPVYSHATISGKTVYVSGSIGCNKDMSLVEGGVQAQTRAALTNMHKILEAAGSGLDHVLKVTVFLPNIARDFALMNEVYKEFFPTSPPARTCIGVAALPLGAEVEIECIAELPVV
ncbi:YjgF-like protein [Obba rivulosa]|uniref:YjgF-like protein n=1 Tax=Obba rivulosa TaxID=1052685 RepID=A0A8E2DM95_9APHY|nr:YjgF-like protein [Obba rivulosa]